MKELEDELLNLISAHADCILHTARFNNRKKSYLMGLVDLKSYMNSLSEMIEMIKEIKVKKDLEL